MREKRILIFCFVLCGLLLYPLNGVAMAVRSEVIERIKEDYKKINASDGIAEEEAVVIAKYYIINNEKYENLSLNKFKVLKSDFNENWLVVSFDATLKYKRQSGLKWYSIHIDKNSGEIKVRGWGPS